MKSGYPDQDKGDAMRKPVIPPTKFGATVSAQPKAANKVAKLHAPPPTKFAAPSATAQPKSLGGAIKIHAPPPTRFSPSSPPIQPKTRAGATRLHAPPPTKFASSPLAQAKTAGGRPMAPSVVQRMDFSQGYDPEAYEQDEFGNVLPKEPEGGWEAYEQDVNRYFAQQYEEEQQRLEEERMDQMIDDHIKDEEEMYQEEIDQQQLQAYEKQEKEVDEYYDGLMEKYNVEQAVQQCLTTPFGTLGDNLRYLRPFMKEGDAPLFSSQEKEQIKKQIMSVITKKMGQLPMMAPSGFGANDKIKFEWANKALNVLKNDGYKTSTLERATQESYTNKRAGEFSGYIFQIEQHIQSWSKCKLLEIEPSTSTYRRADEIPLSYTHKFVDYKNYDKGAEKFSTEVQQQIINYAKDSQGWPQNTILIIKFKHGVPPWYSHIVEQHKNSFRKDVQIRLKTAKQNTFGTKSIMSFFK